MRNVSRPAPFVLISSNHGSLIINRNDYRMIDQTQGYGLGFQIMHNSCYDQQEIDMALTLLYQFQKLLMHLEVWRLSPGSSSRALVRGRGDSGL